MYIKRKGKMKTTKLSKWGNSLAIRIPMKMAQELDLSENSSLGIFTQDDKIIIQKPLSLEDKCKLITAKNLNVYDEWSNESVGNEW